MLTSKERITNALLELGDGPGEIADKLRKMGIKGKQGSSHFCPIAQYLMKRLDAPDANVGDHASVREDGGGWTMCVPLPEPCGDFVCNFDLRHYPDLIEPN